MTNCSYHIWNILRSGKFSLFTYSHLVKTMNQSQTKLRKYMRYPVCMFDVNPLKVEKNRHRAFHASARAQKNCGNRLQSCNKYNVSSFALGHKEIARGRAWSLPIHLARRGFPTVTRKQTRKNRHNWQLSWHHSTHNLLLSTHWSAAEDDDSSSCSKFLKKVQIWI